MVDNSKKVSELPIANSVVATDRVMVLHDPAGNASVKTITTNNFTNSLRYANGSSVGVIKIGDNLTINATGHVSSYYPAYANNSVAGIVKVGNNLTINATGYLTANNTGSWTFDGTRANTGGNQNSLIDGQSPGGLLLYNDYEVTLHANNAYYEFNQDGTLSLPANGNIKVNGVTVAGDIVSNPADDVNDNVWRIINVNGYKEFDYQTPGHLKIHIPITSGLAGTVSQITVNLAGQDLTALRDSYDVGSSIRVYLNDSRNNDHSVYAIRGEGFAYPETQAANEYRISWNSDITLVEGEELTLQYYTRGTKDHYPDWNESATMVPDQTTANTNEIVLDFDTFNINADSLTSLANTQTANCSIRFWSNSNNALDISRNIVSVSNTGNLYTITFDGAPLNVATPTLTTLDVTHARNAAGNDYYIKFDSKRYPEFADCIRYQNNKYTGNADRSGYVVINGDTGNPYDFNYYGEIDNEGMFVIELSTTYHISPTDTVHIHYYKAPTNIALYTYEPQNGSTYYGGKKWFDWTTDLPQKYYNFVGNGVQGGTLKTHVGLYDQATKEWDSATFPETAFDTNNDYGSWFSNDYGSIYPFDNFDEKGLYFYSDWTGWGDSRKLKVRIMYKMELMISEFENRYWF